MARGVLEDLEYGSDRELSKELVRRAVKGDRKAKQELRDLHVTYWEHRGRVLLPREGNDGQH
ncbi:MAG: hypothetical protein ACE5K9_01915 [Candidatus Methylomirabilales bacterium]